MNDGPDNPAAFPRQDDFAMLAEQGMTLRDYFAGQHMAGYIARFDYATTSYPSDIEVAQEAYRYADAMLAERGKADG